MPSRSFCLTSHESDFGRGLASWHSAGAENLERLFFLSANGHAVTTYPFFLRRLLDNYRVEAMECRAVWPGQEAPGKIKNWYPFREDYASFLSFRGLQPGTLVHVGHSFGGTIGLMLALERPELFKKLVIIEPGTLFDRKQALIMPFVPYKKRFASPFIRSTAERLNRFESPAQFMEWARGKATYRNFSDEAMQDYADGGLIKEQDRQGSAYYRLRFPPLWEASLFCGAYYVWNKLEKLKVPTLLLRGEHTGLQSKKNYEAMKKRCQSNPLVELVELQGVGHMVIQEDPDLVSGTVLDWLAAH